MRQDHNFNFFLPNARVENSLMMTSRKVRDLSSRRNSFGVARVTSVDYADLYVGLRLVSGMDEFDRVPIPLTFPGAGARHFMGGLPEVGDYCIVGFLPATSSSVRGTQIPFILNWVLPGPFAGHEWETLVGFPVSEMDLGNPKDRAITQGVFDRVRHKLRHLYPGNYLISSAQGSDLILDEGVTLANRRGGEIRLRDQDNALVTRSLQAFHAGAGVRSYSGMVQRDARSLPGSMVSDGKDWSADQQTVDGLPVAQDHFPASTSPEGQITPSRIFDSHPWGPSLDPRLFLQRGGVIDSAGFVVGDWTDVARYGGKPLLRVAQTGNHNPVTTDVPALTELRWELSHTSDGTLPVTEQTDLFDIDRMPGDVTSEKAKAKLPYLEWVMGSVVGNDPFTRPEEYAIPQVVQVFPQPGVFAAPVGLGVEYHAATLTRLRPPYGGDQTFWSLNKKGQLKAVLGGSKDENSLELAMVGGAKVSVGGALSLDFRGGLSLMSERGDSQSNVGLSLGSKTGAVQIHAGGSAKGSDSVGLNLTSTKGIQVSAASVLSLQAQQAKTQVGSFEVSAVDAIQMTSGGTIQTSAMDVTNVVGGRRVDVYAGPKGGLPTTGPLFEEVYSPTLPGLVAKRTRVERGDILESIGVGDRSTVITVGDFLYETSTGKVVGKAGDNTSRLDSQTGYDLSVTSGDVTLQATQGSAQVSGSVAASLTTNGVATVSGRSVSLRSAIPSIDRGGLVCSGSLDPLTGFPFSFFGVGNPNVRVDL